MQSSASVPLVAAAQSSNRGLETFPAEQCHIGCERGMEVYRSSVNSRLLGDHPIHLHTYTL
jgi:hypothetical protein